MTKQNSTFLYFPMNILTGESLVNYLKTANNEYKYFILLKIAETPHLYNSQKRRKGYEDHHILPLHANGPDIAENCICLSVEDHAEAHFILYKVYGCYYDLCAYKMREGKTQEAFDALRKANVEKMKRAGGQLPASLHNLLCWKKKGVLIHKNKLNVAEKIKEW